MRRIKCLNEGAPPPPPRMTRLPFSATGYRPTARPLVNSIFSVN